MIVSLLPFFFFSILALINYSKKIASLLLSFIYAEKCISIFFEHFISQTTLFKKEKDPLFLYHGKPISPKHFILDIRKIFYT